MHYWYSAVALTYFCEHMLSSTLENSKWKDISRGLSFSDTFPRWILETNDLWTTVSWGWSILRKPPLFFVTNILYFKKFFFFFHNPSFPLLHKGRKPGQRESERLAELCPQLVHTRPWQSSCNSTISISWWDSFYKTYPASLRSGLGPPIFDAVRQLSVFFWD